MQQVSVDLGNVLPQSAVAARNLHVLRGEWTNVWKRKPLGMIKETSHTTFRKCELKIPEVWDKVIREYIICCPVLPWPPLEIE